MTAADFSWAIDLYFEQPSLTGREIFPLLVALPRDETVELLHEAARHPDAERREAAARALKWISAN